MDVADFVQGAQKDLGHRKQELFRISMMAMGADPDPHRLNCLRRSAVVLTYAHWEGFVKSASIRYLKFINSQQVPVDSLKLSLQAAYLTSQFKRGADSAKIRFLGELLGEMDRLRKIVFSVSPERCIDTESNLSSVVFRELVLGLGLEYLDIYSTRQVFIDRQIVSSRNQVAHGELVTFGEVEVDNRVKGVLKLLDTYSDQLIEAVQGSHFLNI
jgi:hypothetical protein